MGRHSYKIGIVAVSGCPGPINCACTDAPSTSLYNKHNTNLRRAIHQERHKFQRQISFVSSISTFSPERRSHVKYRRKQDPGGHREVARVSSLTQLIQGCFPTSVRESPSKNDRVSRRWCPQQWLFSRLAMPQSIPPRLSLSAFIHYHLPHRVSKS